MGAPISKRAHPFSLVSGNRFFRFSELMKLDEQDFLIVDHVYFKLEKCEEHTEVLMRIIRLRL